MNEGRRMYVYLDGLYSTHIVYPGHGVPICGTKAPPIGKPYHGERPRKPTICKKCRAKAKAEGEDSLKAVVS